MPTLIRQKIIQIMQSTKFQNAFTNDSLDDIDEDTDFIRPE